MVTACRDCGGAGVHRKVNTAQQYETTSCRVCNGSGVVYTKE